MKKLALFILVIAASLTTKVAAQFPSSYASRLQFVLDSVSAVYHIKGVSAAVAVPGVGTWEGTYGISETGVPMHSSMALGIGSNTKTFISAMILKMEEQSLISLTDTIGTWIHHPNVSGQITITQLLNHTSGVFSFTDAPDFGDSLVSDFTRVWVPEDIMHFIGTPDFAPGTNWNYSNSNYLLLGLIIKQVMSQPLSTVLRNNILTPAGLNKTWLFPEETPSASIAHVWSDNFGVSGNLEDLISVYNYSNTAMFSLAWAAGAIVSTAADNAQFWSKLIGGQIVNQASLVKMKQTIALSSTTGYGLGIFRYKNFNARTIYSHGGTNLGFINENLADSISGIGISVLTNQDSVSNSVLLSKVVAALHKVTINPPLGVEQLANTDRITVYPNPAKDVIHIGGFTEGTPATVRIYDLTGKEVYNVRINSYKNISLPALSSGTYLLKIASGETGLFKSQLMQVVR